MIDLQSIVARVSEPLESPLADAAYDFETCLTYYSAPFPKIDGQPAADPFTFASISVPYYLHVCTNYGRFSAFVRGTRDYAFHTASAHFGQDALTRYAKRRESENASIVVIGSNKEALFSSPIDELAPNAGFHLRDHWLSYLLYYSSMHDPYAGSETIEQRFKEKEFVGCFQLELQGRERCGLPIENVDEAYFDVNKYAEKYLSKSKPQVRYHGPDLVPISSRSMMQCYWGIASIVLTHRVRPEETLGKLKIFEKHESYSVALLILYGLGQVQNYYNTIVMAPLILYVIELSLLGPLPGQRDYSRESYNQEILDPPWRLYKIASNLSKDIPMLTVNGAGKKATQEFFRDLRASMGIPYYFKKLPIADEVLLQSIIASTDGDIEGNMSWYQWYLSMSHYTSARILGRYSSVTEYLCAILFSSYDNETDQEYEIAPVMVDKDWYLSAFSIFHWGINGHEKSYTRMDRYLETQAKSYYETSFLLSRSEATYLPFSVPKEIIFGQWLRKPEKEFLKDNLRWAYAKTDIGMSY